MREWTKGLVKKVTLEIVYEIVDERTRDIYQKLEKIEKRQEEDFRYLNQKIDTQIGQLRQEMNQLRQEVKEEISQLRQEMREEIGNLKKDIDRINQRIDVLIQMVANLQK